MMRIAILLVLILIAALLGQSLADRGDRGAHAPDGIMVEAGGHQLHLVPSGAGRPGPTVLLETGIGGSAAPTWGWVQHGVERFAPVVSYDRAGLGRSEPGPLPRDGRRIATELHLALANAGIAPPYVFVGHSFGGLIARIFTDLYPADVVGLVLVESSSPRRPDSLAGKAGPPAALARIGGLLKAAPWAARLGLMRIGFALIHTDVDLLPPAERSRQRAYLGSSRLWTGVSHEWQEWFPRTVPEAAVSRDFGDRPLVVLTAGGGARRRTGWFEVQERIAALSTDHVHLEVAGATHGSIVADSSHAQVIVRSIADVLTAVRERRAVRDVARESPPLATAAAGPR